MSTPRPAGGVVLVDKPDGMTSHDVVARVRRLAGTRKVGHAGTLDPAATGLLLIGLDHATRLLTFLVGLDKEYTATIRLGATTVTDDAEGDVLETATADALAAVSDERIASGVAALTGPIRQVPSSVSAIKVDGRRSYARVRSGEEVELAARDVEVSEFDVLAIRRPDGAIDVDVRVTVSSGTYVRALARDLGAGLGVGGHLTALRRTRVGPFAVAAAAPLDESIREHALAPEQVARALFPVVELDEATARDLANGKRIAVDAADSPRVAALAPDGRLIGLVEVAARRARTIVNFPTGAPA